jgi:hypothetical protein
LPPAALLKRKLGHEDPTFTIRVYAKAAKRRERLAGEYLEAFNRALDWAAMGSGADFDPDRPTAVPESEGAKSA